MFVWIRNVSNQQLKVLESGVSFCKTTYFLSKDFVDYVCKNILIFLFNMLNSDHIKCNISSLLKSWWLSWWLCFTGHEHQKSHGRFMEMLISISIRTLLLQTVPKKCYWFADCGCYYAWLASQLTWSEPLWKSIRCQNKDFRANNRASRWVSKWYELPWYSAHKLTYISLLVICHNR